MVFGMFAAVALIGALVVGFFAVETREKTSRRFHSDRSRLP